MAGFNYATAGYQGLSPSSPYVSPVNTIGVSPNAPYIGFMDSNNSPMNFSMPSFTNTGGMVSAPMPIPNFNVPGFDLSGNAPTYTSPINLNGGAGLDLGQPPVAGGMTPSGGIFDYTGAGSTGLTSAQMGSLGLGALQTLGGLYTGLSSINIAKKQMSQQNDQWNKAYAAQQQQYNNKVYNDAVAAKHANPNAPDPEATLAKWKI